MDVKYILIIIYYFKNKFNLHILFLFKFYSIPYFSLIFFIFDELYYFIFINNLNN